MTTIPLTNYVSLGWSMLVITLLVIIVDLIARGLREMVDVDQEARILRSQRIAQGILVFWLIMCVLAGIARYAHF